MIWLLAIAIVYLLASILLVVVLSRAAGMNLGLAGSALLVILWPILATACAALYVCGAFRSPEPEKNQEESE